jgi:hypothetical protein
VDMDGSGEIEWSEFLHVIIQVKRSYRE